MAPERLVCLHWAYHIHFSYSFECIFLTFFNYKLLHKTKEKAFFFLFFSLYLFSLSSYFILTHTRSLSVTRQPHSLASLFPFLLFSHHLPVSSCFLSPLSLILLVSCCRIFLLFSPSGKEKTRKKSSLSTPPFPRQRAKSRFYWDARKYIGDVCLYECSEGETSQSPTPRPSPPPPTTIRAKKIDTIASQFRPLSLSLTVGPFFLLPIPFFAIWRRLNPRAMTLVATTRNTRINKAHWVGEEKTATECQTKLPGI